MNLIPPLDHQDIQNLTQGWQNLSESEQTHLIKQIQALDLNTLQKQKTLVQAPPDTSANLFEPFRAFKEVGDPKAVEEGQARLQAGQMGCLVLAGGQGSRLNFNGPKGMYPVSLIKHKSLFQLLAEKVVAASHQAQTSLPLAIMTSPQNDQVTKDFFVENQRFGLSSSQLSFFSQKELPLLDASGHLFLESSCKIAQGPDGNGGSLKEFVHSGIWSDWVQRGIQYVNLIIIDNPLADPFDAELLGFHCQQAAEITLKCTEKKDPQEQVGLLVQQEDHSRVIEYSEIGEKEKQALDAKGQLQYRCANLSLFCLSMNFIQKVAAIELPLHRAWKKGAWKFETFIFDILPYATKVAALLYPRETCFAPLKNASGDQSLQTVQAAIQSREREIIRRLTGIDPPLMPFELATDFYYPTPDLIEAWKGRQIIRGGYINSSLKNVNI